LDIAVPVVVAGTVLALLLIGFVQYNKKRAEMPNKSMNVPLLSDMHGGSGSGGDEILERTTVADTACKSSSSLEGSAPTDPAECRLSMIAPPPTSSLALGTRQEGFQCDICRKMLMAMNTLHTDAFEISGPDSPGILRLCGGCSVGHCPECGDQLIPSSLSRTTDIESGADAVGKHAICCPTCEYKIITTAAPAVDASPSSTATTEGGAASGTSKSLQKGSVVFDV
jgi:hypothetical protein